MSAESAGNPRPAGSSGTVSSRPAGNSEPESAGALPTAGSYPPASGYRLPERPGVTEDPSWPRVIATTVRLWLARRAGREPGITGPVPGARRPRSRRWAIAFGLAIIVFAAGGVTIVLAMRSDHGGAQARSSASGSTGTGQAALAQAAANREQAAAWIAAQAGHSDIVSCDPVMCAALEAHGFPAGDLLTLNSDSPDPMGAQLVVSTTAVRSQFGDRLPGVYAPVVIASFGTGAMRVDVRIEAADGSRAYLIAQRADLLARRAAGRQLLRNRAFHVPAAWRKAVAGGRVDSRLLITLAALAAQQHKVYVSKFGDAGPGAAPGVPLRMVRIAALTARKGPRKDAYLHAVTKFLRAQRAPFRGSFKVLHPGARTVIQIEFPAPSPLGLLGKHAKP